MWSIKNSKQEMSKLEVLLRKAGEEGLAPAEKISRIAAGARA
jgi:hypothetical protein